MVGGLALLVVGFLLFRPDTLFTDVRVDEQLGEAFATTTAIVDRESTLNTTAVTNASPTTTGTKTFEVGQGSFSGIGHRAAGTVRFYEQGGQLVLRFEDDTDIQNGPDLYVWLLPTSSYQGGIPTEYLDLGKLKGNVGGQNYELPTEFEPDLHRTVLIWCLRFSVAFASASLR